MSRINKIFFILKIIFIQTRRKTKQILNDNMLELCKKLPKQIIPEIRFKCGIIWRYTI
jgi:hypothetical protein